MKQIVTVLAAIIAYSLAFQSAQAFPDRPVKLVVASPAGGPPDVMARLVSDKMAGVLGQPVIVDNRPGAGGTIGAKSVLAAEPDGYTLMMGSTSNLLIAPSTYKNAGYNAASIRSGRSCRGQQRSSCRASVGFRQIGCRIDRPGEIQARYLNFASAGSGTLPHIEGELLKSLAQIEINHVPYRGGGNALTGLLAGQIELLFTALTQMLPYIQEGRLRALAISSATRSKLAPDIPTMVESGFGQFVTTSISVVVAPPNTPIEIRRQLSKAVAGALASEDVQRSLSRMGGEARPSSPEETAALLAKHNTLGWHHKGHTALG